MCCTPTATCPCCTTSGAASSAGKNPPAPSCRTREFWWQEGHTIHETADEAKAETEQQLNCYADFAEHDLCIPVVKGRKTDKEKFAGAEATYHHRGHDEGRQGPAERHEPLLWR